MRDSGVSRLMFQYPVDLELGHVLAGRETWRFRFRGISAQIQLAWPGWSGSSFMIEWFLFKRYA